MRGTAGSRCGGGAAGLSSLESARSPSAVSTSLDRSRANIGELLPRRVVVGCVEDGRGGFDAGNGGVLPTAASARGDGSGASLCGTAGGKERPGVSFFMLRGAETTSAAGTASLIACACCASTNAQRKFNTRGAPGSSRRSSSFGHASVNVCSMARHTVSSPTPRNRSCLAARAYAASRSHGRRNSVPSVVDTAAVESGPSS